MSGGHFNYDQFRINDIADSIKEYIKDNKYEYSKETIQEFMNGIRTLNVARIYAQRIDWLLSGDDGEDSFHKRLVEEIDALCKGEI
jgi:hypothetical protein